MRIRFKPYARPELMAWPYYVNTPAEHKGRWRQAFACPELPMRLELGCGKGGFLAQLALREPTFNYFGIDLKSEMLVLAKRNIEHYYAQAQKDISNVLITSQQIELMDQIFSTEDKFERVYINFCNPWHKSGYAKHRLTHPRQLVRIRDVLAEGGEVWFKTDDQHLFVESLRYFEYTGFVVNWHTQDLHAEEPAWNIRTEHENMFSEKGKPIFACIAKMQPALLDRDAILRLKNL